MKIVIKKNNLYYVVKKDDNLEEIAKKYKINPLKILILNNITPNMIKEGKILFIEK